MTMTHERNTIGGQLQGTALNLRKPLTSTQRRVTYYLPGCFHQSCYRGGVAVTCEHDPERIVAHPGNVTFQEKGDRLLFECWPEKSKAGWEARFGVPRGMFGGVSISGEIVDSFTNQDGSVSVREFRLEEISLVANPSDEATSVRYLTPGELEEERIKRRHVW